MDNKKMLIGMTLVLMLVMGYYAFLVKFVYPHHPEWDLNGKLRQPPTETSTTIPSTAPSTMPSLASSHPSVMTATSAPAGSLHLDPTPVKSTQIILGSDKRNDPTYCIGLELTSDGAAVDSAILNQYNAVDDTKQLYSFQNAYSDHDNTSALATRDIVVNGQTLDISGAPWALESSATNTATFGIYVDNDADAKILHVTKTYTVDPQGPAKNRDNTSAGYEITLAYHVQNLTTQPQTVHIDFNGPTMPPKEVERGADRQLLSGYNKGNNLVDVVRHPIEEFKTAADTKDLFKHDKGYKFLWAGASSAYFDAIVLPVNPATIASVQAKAINLDSPTEDHEIVLNFATADMKLLAAGVADIPLKVFMGPKERPLLEGDYYSSFPRFYKDTLVTSSSYCSICSFPWLIDRLVDLLRFFHFFLRDWGLAIILLVVIVRLCLHPITKQSQVSMMKMQKMGPELERLKKKYGDDKEAFAKAQMQVYKEVGFTPILGCLPMFLQMPIWIALYAALQGEIALRQAPFLWGYTWIHDLARPDRLFAWDAHPITIPILGAKMVSLNFLPVILAVAFFLQQKFTPKPPATTPEQGQQQKMMQWMSLLFPVFLYSAPSGLNLYICASTTVGIWESKRIRDHIKRRQEAEKSDKVIVDAKPTRAGKQNKLEHKRDQADAKKNEKSGCLGGWWANMQQKVEDVRREAERTNKKM